MKDFQWVTVFRKKVVSSIQSVAAVEFTGRRQLGKLGVPTDSRDNFPQNDDSHHCAIVLGPTGSGRSTAVVQAIQKLKLEHVSFDFNTINHRSFVPFLIEFYSKVLEQLEHIIICEPSLKGHLYDINSSAQFVFKAITDENPQFRNIVNNFVKDTAQSLYPSSLASSPKVLKQLRSVVTAKSREKSAAEDVFRNVCKIIAEAPTPWMTGSKPKHLTSCISAVLAIAEYEENSAAYIRTKRRVQLYPTAEQSLRYVLDVVSSLSHTINRPICLLMKNIEVLSRSPFLQERGHAFLTNLIYLLGKSKVICSPIGDHLSAKNSGFSNIPAFLITDDSMLVLRLLSVPHIAALDLLASHHGTSTKNESILKDRTEMREQSSLSRDKECGRKSLIHARIISVDEWPKDLVRQVYKTVVTENQDVVDGVFDSVGGLPSYLHRVAMGIHKSDKTMQKELYSRNIHLIKELRVTQDDVSNISHKHLTAQEKVEVERHRRQQSYVRDILALELPKEVLAFQWKTNQFLSLPILENLRIQSKTRVMYFVTVLETIRILLSKPYWTIERSDLSEISHPVILGLLDTKLFSMRFHPVTTIQAYDRLTHNLLHSFINEKFESLSLVDRIKYNATYGVNSKELRNRVVHMTKH